MSISTLGNSLFLRIWLQPESKWWPMALSRFATELVNYCWKQILPKLRDIKHLWSHNFCGSGVQAQLSWTELENPLPSSLTLQPAGLMPGSHDGESPEAAHSTAGDPRDRQPKALGQKPLDFCNFVSEVILHDFYNIPFMGSHQARFILKERECTGCGHQGVDTMGDHLSASLGGYPVCLHIRGSNGRC